MTRTTRWAAVLFFSVAPLAGLTYAYPEWPTDAGLDVWNEPTLRTEFDEQTRHQEELERFGKATTDRINRKMEIARDLVDARIGLADAARECRTLNAANPQLLPLMQLRFPRAGEDELHVRNTLLTAAGVLEGRRDRDIVLARLDRDLNAMLLEGGGRIVLGNR